MIRPHMVEMATQTTLAPDDPRLGRDAATLWAQQNAFDLEPAQTVRAEIYAQLMNHIRLVPSSAQEPVVAMNGISQSGVRRFFQGWPKKVELTATVWTCHSPKHLHSLLKLETVSSRRALGPCRLHVRGAEAHGHRLLMAMPPFTAWFNVSRKGRTELRMSFKILVFQDTTDLTPPPVCDFQQNPETDGALCDECVAGDVEARVQSEPCVLHDAGTAGQGAESGGARSGTQCALNCSQETGSDGVGGLVGIRVGERSMRVSAQRNWQRVGLRMRRSDGRGILRSMIAESGCSRSVVAESAERGCRRVDCARIRTELAVVKRRMLELETNFDILVTQSVHAAVKCRDVAQATLLLKLEEQLATMQKRAWRMDHVRVKREEWQHLHTLHHSALAKNSTPRSKVSALERKLVLAERKGGEASSACNKIRVALSAKRSGDALERSQACFASSAR